MDVKNQKRRAVILILIAGVLWGTSGIFVNFLSPIGFTSIQLTAVRATVSSVFIIAFMLAKSRKSFSAKPGELLLFLALAVTLFFSCFLYYTAMVMTSVCTAVILLDMYPVYVTLFSAILFREKMTVTKVVCIAVMIVGGGFVSGIIGGLKFDALGLIIGALSGVSYASYVLLVKFYNGRGVSSSSANLYSFLFMALIALSICEPISLFTVMTDNLAIALPLFIGLGVCTFVVPFVLNAKALKVLPAGTASALCVMEPFSASLFSVLLFHEPLDFGKILGAVLILSAVVVLGISETAEE